MSPKKQVFRSKSIFKKKNILRGLKSFGGFLSHYKVVLGILLGIFLILLFLIRLTLGSFGFLTSSLPSLTGFWGEQRYLILLQNENELRPSGGFLTSFAVLEMKFGKPNLMFFDSTMVELPGEEISAPLPLERVLTKDPKYAGWTFRDSNFALDFRESAEQAVWFLQQDKRFSDMEFDAVFALDLFAIGQVVDLFSPLEVEGAALNSDNIFEILEKSSKDFDLHDEEEWESRKNILTPLAKDLLKNIADTPTKWGDFFDLMTRLANEKHFMLNFVDNNLQAKILDRSWSGALPEGDFFSINWANIGGRKVDRYLQKNYWSSFMVDSEGQITEKLSMRLAQEGTYNLQSDRYEAYVQIIRPQGTKLLASSGDFATKIGTKEQEGYTVFSHFIVLNPSDTKTFTYDFALPSKMLFNQDVPWQIVKQAGTRKELYQLNWRGMNDTSFDIAGCDIQRHAENVFFCDVYLNANRNLVVNRLPDTSAPILQWAEFNSLGQIEMRFSEQISPVLATSDVQIVDLNRNNPAKTDIVQITEVEISDLAVLISVQGVSAQKGEFYQITIPDLHDISGNYTTRQPFKTTIVQ